MAKRAPDTAPVGAIPARTRPHSMIWLQGLLCGAIVTFAPPTALLMGILLGPTLLALLLDRQPGRPKARSVALFGMAASIEPLRSLWANGHTMSVVPSLLGLRVVGMAWAAAAAGWLLAEVAPVAVRATLEALSVSRTVRLRALRARLTEEWGLDQADADQ
jgi:hypothetical protein